MKNYSHAKEPITETSPTAFQFAYIAFAIDITDGLGLSNEACR